MVGSRVRTRGGRAWVVIVTEARRRCGRPTSGDRGGRAPGAGTVSVVARWAGLAPPHPFVRFGLVFGIGAMAWFAFGPADGQRSAVAVVTPVYAGLIAVGQWRVGADPRLRPAAKRFWRILSASMIMYAAGMLVNLTALVFG